MSGTPKLGLCGAEGAADAHQEGYLRLRPQAPHPARRSRSASTRGGPVARGARGLRMGRAMMGEGRRAVDRAQTASRDRAARRRLPAGREGGLKELLSPNLCPSCAGAAQRLPSPCACVYSSPSRRTPVDAAARTPRTGYCGRRMRSDRPFRTGLQRWLEEEEILPRAPVFHEFLESICFFNFKVLFGRRVRSWLRTNAGGAPNTCKSRG